MFTRTILPQHTLRPKRPSGLSHTISCSTHAGASNVHSHYPSSAHAEAQAAQRAVAHHQLQHARRSV